MLAPFKTIGLIGKHTNPEVHGTLAALVPFLQSHSIKVVLEEHCAQILPEFSLKGVKKDEIGSLCDLIIVVGGDGSLLNAARAVIDNQIPVLGINRGRRGFLTDISPQLLTQSLELILLGKYQAEKRFLLEMQLLRNKKVIGRSLALNEVVLYSGDIARMLEFELFIDQRFVYRQRSDGLISATPTGSTAYALAGGGPILHPKLNAIVLVPMHPAVLSSRPIVIDSDVSIELHIVQENLLNPRVSCDGQVHFDAMPGDSIHIRRYAKVLHLLHPTDHDYFHILRTKLGWSA